MTDLSNEDSGINFEPVAAGLLVLLAVVKITVHLLTNGAGAYGYFRDELYYLDCARHLDWGYVDQPPFSILILAVTRALIGVSTLAIRLPAVLAGAATIVTTGLIAREMGGGRFAQFLSGLCVLGAGVFLSMGGFFSMNAFDQFFWALAVLLLVRLIRTDNPNLWLAFGLVAGIGLENKISVGFLGLGVVAAMPFTPLRKHFLKWQLWAGGLIAALIFLPHIYWQVRYGWPTLEFMRNARLYKNMPTPFFKFVLQEILLAGPLSAPLWIAGILYGLMSKRGRTFAAISIAFIVVFAVVFISNGKVYYLAPAYPMLFALGAVWFERIAADRRWAMAGAAGFVCVGGIALAPYAITVLPPTGFLRFQNTLGIKAPQQERTHAGALPQHLGDRLGWEAFVAMVAEAYARLDPADRARCAIFTSNYGEAGAIDLFGPRYGLPRAISGHMTHYLWGPGDATGDVMLVYWDQREELLKLFDSVVEVARFKHPYVMERQNDRPLYLCRGLKRPIAEVWPLVKAFQ